MASKRRSAAKSAPKNEKPGDDDPLFVKLARACEEGWQRGMAEGFAASWTIVVMFPPGSDAQRVALRWIAASIATEAIRRFGEDARRELHARGWDGEL